MFSRNRFLLLSPWGTVPTLALLGESHADLKPLIIAIKRVGSPSVVSDGCTSFLRPAALIARRSASSCPPCQWQGVEAQVLDPGIVSVLQKREG
jgi:hypothetical protein